MITSAYPLLISGTGVFLSKVVSEFRLTSVQVHNRFSLDIKYRYITSQLENGEVGASFSFSSHMVK